MKKLYIVIPCYNEEEALKETSKRLLLKMKSLQSKISPSSRIVFVNDGSQDKTWDIIQELHDQNPFFCGINLSRNRGHQNALLAGLLTVTPYCDMAISMDADLQDDINAIDEMIDKFYDGNDIVYGVRSKRATDTVFKRATAEGFYKLMSYLGVDCIYNHADYRLMSKKALEGLAQFKEINLFLRGIVPAIGFKSACVYYERKERVAGESKYPLKKMLSFAIEGITSFSIKPIRGITALGCFISLISIIMLIFSLIGYINGKTIPGWSSIMVSLWFLGGLLMFSIGLIGEYIGKIYLETKGRPRFLVDEYLGDVIELED